MANYVLHLVQLLASLCAAPSSLVYGEYKAKWEMKLDIRTSCQDGTAKDCEIFAVREQPVRQVRIKRAMAISGSASGSGFQNEMTTILSWVANFWLRLFYNKKNYDNAKDRTCTRK
ncbi:uncharacterized protein LOC124458009 isoform X2 [Xenia sp. Carnegie-2017]|nr:uncharacterized protein LOC124458009 isoform X2 [Xenia sp. Carnegie-2017]